jgi:hypothetical protein
VAAQQHDHAFLVVRDDAHRVLHRVGVAARVEVEESSETKGSCTRTSIGRSGAGSPFTSA